MHAESIPPNYDQDPDRQLPVYILVGLRDETGRVAVAADLSSYGLAIQCFLSPIDALLEMAFAERNERYGVLDVWPAGRAPKHTLFADGEYQKPLSIHVAWFADRERLLVSSDGYPCRLVRDQGVRQRAQELDRALMVVDCSTVALINHVYEKAGLYAWRETQESVRKQFAAPFILQAELRRAIASFDDIETVTMEIDHATQLALYDPEAAQWHFIPRTAADEFKDF